MSWKVTWKASEISKENVVSIQTMASWFPDMFHSPDETGSNESRMCRFTKLFHDLGLCSMVLEQKTGTLVRIERT